MTKRANGEGSIFRRTDGRYVGAYYTETTDGRRVRRYLYGPTRAGVHAQLQEKTRAVRRGVRAPARSWTVGEYLHYWLDNVVAVRNRQTTQTRYRSIVRIHLEPAIGKQPLATLSVSTVQHMINMKLAGGTSVRTVHAVRAALRAALSRAEREEIVFRNVAKLVDLPPWHRKAITPWTPLQAQLFLTEARSHRWYPAYLLLITYGLRRGEVIGLSWQQVDMEQGTIRVSQQLQRINGQLTLGDVKTEAGQRLLPIVPRVLRELTLLSHEHRSGSDLVFTSSTGTPIDPKNFVRTFHQIAAAAGLPRIKLHHVRHTTATMLKDLGVPARDAQLILGHAHVTTTQQLYQHGDISQQKIALEKLEGVLYHRSDDGVQLPVAVNVAVKLGFSTGRRPIWEALTSGGPGGTRTLDTLLKRGPQHTEFGAFTADLQRLLTRAYTCELGRVAVTVAVSQPPAEQGEQPLDHALIYRTTRDLLQQIGDA